VGPRADLDTEARGKILRPYRGSSLDRPVVQPVARHCTELSGSRRTLTLENNVSFNELTKEGYSSLLRGLETISVRINIVLNFVSCMRYQRRLRSIVVSVLATGPRGRRLEPAKAMDF
jgi:hypothetical protein